MTSKLHTASSTAAFIILLPRGIHGVLGVALPVLNESLQRKTKFQIYGNVVKVEHVSLAFFFWILSEDIIDGFLHPGWNVPCSIF